MRMPCDDGKSPAAGAAHRGIRSPFSEVEMSACPFPAEAILRERQIQVQSLMQAALSIRNDLALKLTGSGLILARESFGCGSDKVSSETPECTAWIIHDTSPLINGNCQPRFVSRAEDNRIAIRSSERSAGGLS